MRSAAISDPGRCRATNEDSIYADPAQGLFILADGMGGHLAGEVASSIAVKTVAAFLAEGPAANGDEPTLLLQAIERAHETIRAKAAGDADLSGMGTTVVVVLARPGVLHIAHVGDSRAYLFDGAGSALRQLTRDHSLVAQMAAAGQITPKEARSHRLRNYLMRSLGAPGEHQPDVQTVAWGPRDWLLICSDGLTSMVDDTGIAKLLARAQGDLERACDLLTRAANAKGGKDNISVILACPE